MKQENSAIAFQNGLNCAQSVLSVFCEKYSLPLYMANKLSGGFGGGARCGELCGAVSGALIVVGLKYGQETTDDLKAKELCNLKTIEFTDAFKDKFKTLTCKGLLDAYLPIEKDENIPQYNSAKKAVCTDFVRYAVSLLESLGY